jgi:hypothetical protein
VARRKTTKQAPARKAKARPAPEPGHHDLMRGPDMTATAAVRFTCGVYVRVTHPDYKPHEVVALLGAGQVQMDPIAPGQVGTLILDGFPYTVLGYYTLSAEDAGFEQAPAGWAFHGTSSDKARQKAARRPGDGAKAAKSGGAARASSGRRRRG